MIANRSVPVDTILPHVQYRNVPDAIEWLTRVFGFTEHYRYGEPISGAQMHLGATYVMLHTARASVIPPQSLTVFVEGVDAHFARAKSAGANIVEDLHETVYGERQYGVEDLDGNHWLFSRHARDVSPEEWGAQLAATSER